MNAKFISRLRRDDRAHLPAAQVLKAAIRSHMGAKNLLVAQYKRNMLLDALQKPEQPRRLTEGVTGTDLIRLYRVQDWKKECVINKGKMGDYTVPKNPAFIGKRSSFKIVLNRKERRLLILSSVLLPKTKMPFL